MMWGRTRDRVGPYQPIGPWGVNMRKIKLFAIMILISLVLCGCKAKNPWIDFEGMEAAEKAFSERQQKRLVAYMSLETMFPDEQVRALAKAAGRGQMKKVDALVAKGVEVNARGTSNATPLFWALKKRNLKGVIRLLELGADPNIMYDDGGSVIHWAASYGKYLLLEAVLQHGGDPNLISSGGFKETPLFEVIDLIFRPDDIRCLNLLVDYGADVNAVSLGATPVISAANLGRFDLVKELLKRGADYRLQNNHGETLLDVIASDKDRYIPGSKQEKALRNLIEWLEQRGISLPETTN